MVAIGVAIWRGEMIVADPALVEMEAEETNERIDKVGINCRDWSLLYHS